jgi:hypothetical protein
MTQNSADRSSFDKKINTFDDSRSLKIAEQKLKKMIKPYD